MPGAQKMVQFECPCSIERNWLGRNDINSLSLLWNLVLLQAEKINYHPSDMKLIGIFHWIKYITMSGNLSSFKLELRNDYQANNRHYHLHTFHLKRLLKLGNTQVVNCSLHTPDISNDSSDWGGLIGSWDTWQGAQEGVASPGMMGPLKVFSRGRWTGRFI